MDVMENIKLFVQRFNGDRLALEWFDKKRDFKKQFAPHCNNKFSSVCLLGKGVVSPCKKCEHKSYSGWTEKTAKDHIFGSIIDKRCNKIQSHGVYLLRENGLCHFGAVDFDDKHTFNDVRDFYHAAYDYGLAGHIARSTNKGWHIYYFFSEPVPAIKIRSAVFGVMRDFDWAVIPEVFPKQNTVQENDFGNLIKPPMIHPNMVEGRNCFVNEGDIPIGNNSIEGVRIEEQWEYLKSATTISEYELDDIINENSFDLNIDKKSGHVYTAQENIPWSEPRTGDFVKVIQGCETIQNIIEKPFEVSHEHRFGMAIVAGHCKNGFDHLRSIFPAGEHEWERGSDVDENGKLRGSKPVEDIINQVKQYNYKPYTCQKFKDIGACSKCGTCVEKRRRMTKENGVLVPLPGEYVEPTPFRFAIDKQTGVSPSDILMLAKTTEGKDQEHVVNLFNEHIDQIISFDESHRLLILDEFKRSGKLSHKIMKAIIKEAEKSAKGVIGENQEEFVFSGETYRADYGKHRLVKLIPGKEETKIIEFTNFIPNLKEIKVLRTTEDDEIVVYCGSLDTGGRVFNFEIEESEWHNRRLLPQKIGRLTNGEAILKEKYAEDFLLFTNELSRESRVTRSILTSFGYYGENHEMYFSPSVTIDKDGIYPNDNQELDLSQGRLSRHADFMLLDEKEFKEVLKFFWENISTWLAPESTLPVLAYYFLTPIMGRFGNGGMEKPALWMQGTPSTGKTTLARILNCLFGDFFPLSRKNTWMSSYNHICKEGSYMKDLPYLVDDYRSAIIKKSEAEKVINNYYDEIGRGTLSRSSNFNDTRVIKGNLIITGEDIPKDGGSISRCLVVSFNPVKPDKEKLDAIESKLDLYKGITPYYIHHLYQYDTSDFLQKITNWIEYFNGVAQGFCDARVTKNAGLLSLGAEMFVSLLSKYAIISKTDEKIIMNQFLTSIRLEVLDTSIEANKNQGANQFMDTLKDLISMNAVLIDGLNNEKAQYKPQIGWIDIENGVPCDEFVYINKSASLTEVRQFLKRSDDKLTHGERTIFQQLTKMSAVGDGVSVTRKRHNGSLQRVWVIKKSFLDIVDILRPVEYEDHHEFYNVEDATKENPFSL